METILIVLAVLAALVLLAWLGLKIQPAPFPPFPQQSPQPQTVPLPAGLPAPVERYYRKIYGERIPVITSAVFTGRATLRPFGPLSFPGRFRFTHDAGRGYRHYIEVTFFGFPILKVNERYLDGTALGELPFGAAPQGPKLNQAANLGMWAESMSMPSLFFTDPRVHWEPVDADSALLVVPFEDTQERFLVRFNPDSGLMRYAEVMRYQNETSATKSLWITHSLEETWVNGTLAHAVGSATWLQDGKPWAVFATEEIRLNVDIRSYLGARGV